MEYKNSSYIVKNPLSLFHDVYQPKNHEEYIENICNHRYHSIHVCIPKGCLGEVLSEVESQSKGEVKDEEEKAKA